MRAVYERLKVAFNEIECAAGFGPRITTVSRSGATTTVATTPLSTPII